MLTIDGTLRNLFGSETGVNEMTDNNPMKLALEQGKKIQKSFTFWGWVKSWFTK